MFSNKLEKSDFCTITACEYKVVKPCWQWLALLLGVEMQLLGVRGNTMKVRQARRGCVF